MRFADFEMDSPPLYCPRQRAGAHRGDSPPPEWLVNRAAVVFARWCYRRHLDRISHVRGTRGYCHQFRHHLRQRSCIRKAAPVGAKVELYPMLWLRQRTNHDEVSG